MLGLFRKQHFLKLAEWETSNGIFTEKPTTWHLLCIRKQDENEQKQKDAPFGQTFSM